MAGTAGGSAHREYERRRERDRERRRAGLPITIPIVILTFPVMFLVVHALVGVFNDAVRGATSVSTIATPSAVPARPALDADTVNLVAAVFALGATASVGKAVWGRRPTTESWRIGAEGEQRVARQLDRLVRDGYQVLHDARVPGSRANIDHVVVGPTGIFTVETKSYSGKVTLSRSWFARETTAMHSGRRLDRVVEQALREAEVVSAVVRSALPARAVGVQAIVAVDRATLECGWFVRPVTRGVRWCSARRLPRVIEQGATSLSGEDIAAIADALRRALAVSSLYL